MHFPTVTTSFLVVVVASAPEPSSPAKTYERGLASTAVVYTTHRGLLGQSSAVLVDRERKWLVASWHSVRGAEDITALFPLYDKGKLATAPLPYQERRREGKAIPAKVLVADPRRDLVLLQLDSVPEAVPPAVLVARPPGARENVTFIGNPAARNVMWSQTQATVLRGGRRAWKYDGGQAVDTAVLDVQVREALTSGWSGGPVLTSRQEVAGLILAAEAKNSTTILCVEARAVRQFLNESHASLGWDALARAEIPDAAAHADALLDADPRAAAAFRLRGCARLLQGDRRGAGRDFQAALRPRPQQPFTLLARCGALALRLACPSTAATEITPRRSAP